MPYDENIDLLEGIERETTRLVRRANRLVEALASRVGLDANDFRCMFLLRRQGPMPASRLAELAGLTEEAIAGVVEQLERVGLVVRHRVPGDRRVLLRVDDAAHRARIEPALRDLREAWYPLVRRRCDDLGLIAVLLAESRRLTEIAAPFTS